jgi:uncharacterized membrane protein YphA (DoxX/SURF4 family)
MNTIFWILQALTAAVFMYSGINKSIYSEQTLVSKGQTGVQGLPVGWIRFIGITEIIGAIGLILPVALKILPSLTMISATGFAIIMILAVRIHYKRAEPRCVVNNLILLGLCVAIAWYRF